MYSIKNKALLLILTIISSFACATPRPQLKTVPWVDIPKYTGEWYEVARLPHISQEGCYGSKATYTLLEDQKIGVLNECHIGGPDGKISAAKAIAWVVDKTTNAKLKLSFLLPYTGDYWIIDLGENYEYAVVSHPEKQYLWILSRSKHIDRDQYNNILERLKLQHFDTSKLILTAEQSAYLVQARSGNSKY
jgi:apolipoprotein D and lipocalin family protein